MLWKAVKSAYKTSEHVEIELAHLVNLALFSGISNEIENRDQT